MPPLDRPFIRHDRWTDRLDAWMSKSLRWLIVVNIVLGMFTLFNLVIYPKYIYEAPEPVLISEPIDQLSPYEI